jgi:hypothetical protein
MRNKSLSYSDKTDFETMTITMSIGTKTITFEPIQKYGQLSDVIQRYRISRSSILKLRDTDPKFPKYFKRGQLYIYDITKLDTYFSA